LAGDVVTIRFTSVTGQSLTPVRGSTSGFFTNDILTGQQVTFIAASTSSTSWTETLVDRHPATSSLVFSSDNAFPVRISGRTQEASVTSAGRDLLDDADAAAQRVTMGAAASGSITTSGLTQATARLLGRTTASTGAVEELSASDVRTFLNTDESTDTRDPNAHAASHAAAGSDPVTLELTQVVAPSGGIGPLGNGESLYDYFSSAGNIVFSNTEDFVASGSITTSGLTQATARILGRTSSSAGAIEELAASDVRSFLNVADGAEVNVNADWNASSGDAQILNKPTLAASATTDTTNASNISTGTLAVARMGSGTPSASNYLRGDGSWQTVTAGVGGGTGSTDNSILRSNGTGGSTLQASGLVIEDTVTALTSITGDAGTDIITATGSAFANGQKVRFTALTGGSGLNTTTNYFVINVSGATFQLSTTEGGSASLFTTNITAGTLLTGHAVQTHVQISNASSDTNSALVLTPKGTGAFVLGPAPNAGASTGGNSRGNYAVDLQIQRNAATQVASGPNSGILSGQNNSNPGELSVIAGGQNNSTSGIGIYACFIGAGINNSFTSIAEYSVIAGGRSNSTTQQYVSIGGGFSNSCTQVRGTIAGGQSNVVSGDSATVGGGNGNTASSDYSFIAGGYQAGANRYGIMAHAAGQFSAQGDAQRIRAVLRCKTTTNAAVEMALNGSTTYFTIPSGKVIFCNIKVVGVKSDGAVVATYERQYAAKNVAGTSSEVYAAVTIGTDNASSTSLEIATVDAGDYIRIRPTGITSEVWRWVATVDAVEVAYGT
jgi:hypothetical protein